MHPSIISYLFQRKPLIFGQSYDSTVHAKLDNHNCEWREYKNSGI